MPKKPRPIHWLFEPLESDPRFEQRRLFMMDSAYVDGRLCLAASTDQEEPWNGLLVCTDRERHESLTRDFPDLKPHKVLGKWLYLSPSHPDYETIAPGLVTLVRRRDPRIGVEPQEKKKKRPKPKGSRRPKKR